LPLRRAARKPARNAVEAEQIARIADAIMGEMSEYPLKTFRARSVSGWSKPAIDGKEPELRFAIISCQRSPPTA
jgi:hypothetical protein